MTWQLGIDLSINGQCVAANTSDNVAAGGTSAVGAAYPWYSLPNNPGIAVDLQVVNYGDADAPGVIIEKLSFKGDIPVTQFAPAQDIAPGQVISSQEPFVWQPTPATPYTGFDSFGVIVTDPDGNSWGATVYLLRDPSQLTDLQNDPTVLSSDNGCSLGQTPQGSASSAGGSTLVPILLLGAGALLVVVSLGRRQ